MIERKRKTKEPCQGCGLHPELCLCALFPKLSLKTRVTLVIHAKELKRTTNTGRLAIQALLNSEMRVRGASKDPVDLSDLLEGPFQTLLFFPSEDAAELTEDFVSQFDRPIHLIVPDGNWRQASKVHYRHQELKDVPRVMIKAPNLSAYHLRKETTQEGMATLQAIAQALGAIEGPSVKEQLLALYEEKLQRTLKGRGVRI